MSFDIAVKKNRPKIQYPSPNISMRCKDMKVRVTLRMNEKLSKNFIIPPAPLFFNNIEIAPYPSYPSSGKRFDMPVARFIYPKIRTYPCSAFTKGSVIRKISKFMQGPASKIPIS